MCVCVKNEGSVGRKGVSFLFVSLRRGTGLSKLDFPSVEE